MGSWKQLLQYMHYLHALAASTRPRELLVPINRLVVSSGSSLLTLSLSCRPLEDDS